MNDDLLGQRVLRRYRIIQSLGSGGMGVVYLARTEGAEGFAKPVVVKSILPKLLERAEMADMFVREARILSNLSHPGIVRVLDFGREGQRYLMVLEYVSGYDLGRWRRFLSKTEQQGPISLAVHIVCQVLNALHYAHTARRGDGTSLTTVHRDVSPSNILLSDEGQVRLVDFGIASVVSDFGENTRRGGFKGKFVYAAPELLTGASPTPQSDLYSAALVLYQLISGRNPFSAGTDAEIVDRVLTLELPSLRAGRPEVSAHLEGVVRTALSREPSQRFESAAHFADALRRTQDVPEDQLRQVLAERVRADFYGALPEIMDTERLEDRDEAWRFASIPPSSAGRQRVANISSPAGGPITVIEGPNSAPLQLPILTGKQRRIRRIRKRLSVALPAAGLATALGWWSISDGTADRGALAEPGGEKSDSIAITREPTEPEPAPPPPSADTHSEPEPETPLPPSQALKLANTVGENAVLISDCFTAHGLSPAPAEIRLGFRLKADGKVQRVTLDPPELASTDFGKCLAVSYREVSFGAQGRALKFHVPVRLGEVLATAGVPSSAP